MRIAVCTIDMFMLSKKCGRYFSEKKYPSGKNSRISGNFFLPGEISGKISPGDFRGTPPGKFPEIPGNPENSRKNSCVFPCFPAGNKAYPLKIRVFFPQKEGVPGKISGIFRKIVPPEIPEISRNSPKFSPEFPGGTPSGAPRTFQARIEDFLSKIWSKFGQK